MILALDELPFLAFTSAIPMAGINPQSIRRRSIVCGAEKSLNGGFFQVVRTFAEGYSFYCNLCDKESKQLKRHPNSRGTPVLVNSNKSLDLKEESPA